ncbi:MAG: EF-hand domain-containing protein [Luteimonas sp.]|nr:EF-hand domain-containing protein [Luteimonas sp.]
MKNARKPLAGLIALGAALALPVAFAQDAQTQDPTEAHDPTSQHATPQPAPEAASQPLTWADVDADGDGKLSKDEAARVPTLAQVFDDADADNDGLLTQEEYQAYVAQNDSTAPSPTEGGGDD